LLNIKKMTSKHITKEGLTTTLLPTSINSDELTKKAAPKRQIFYGQALFCAIIGGFFQFLNGYLENMDLAVTALNFSGFLFIALAYKAFQIITYKKEGSAFK
jgi:hypothetical protein